MVSTTIDNLHLWQTFHSLLSARPFMDKASWKNLDHATSLHAWVVLLIFSNQTCFYAKVSFWKTISSRVPLKSTRHLHPKTIYSPGRLNWKLENKGFQKEFQRNLLSGAYLSRCPTQRKPFRGKNAPPICSCLSGDFPHMTGGNGKFTVHLAYQEIVKAQYLHDSLRGATSIVSSAKLLSKSCAIHVET